MTAFMLPVACKMNKAVTGYTRITAGFDRIAADKRKKEIISVSDDIFVPGQYAKSGDTIRYRLLPPPSITPGQHYPLVLVLHSSGTPIGKDNVKQLGVLAKLWAQPGIREQYPAYVLAPQFPKRSSNYVPTAEPNIVTSEPDPSLETALSLLDSLKQVLPIEQRKMYVIGFSMGASTAINAVGLRPKLFAAVISISGIPEFKQIDAIADVPAWFIHGNADFENPIASDSLLYRQLKERHDQQARFWEIDKLQHEIYPGLYMGSAIPEWFWRYQRSH